MLKSLTPLILITFSICSLVDLYNTQSLKLFSMDISGKEEYRDKKRFMYGESMGGAVALLIHKKDPAFWHGAVLVAPMCKVMECFRIGLMFSSLVNVSGENRVVSNVK